MKKQDFISPFETGSHCAAQAGLKLTILLPLSLLRVEVIGVRYTAQQCLVLLCFVCFVLRQRLMMALNTHMCTGVCYVYRCVCYVYSCVCAMCVCYVYRWVCACVSADTVADRRECWIPWSWELQVM